MPEWTRLLRPRLANLRLSPEREEEIIEELSQHLDQRYEDLRGEGIDDEDARKLAMDELLEPDALAHHMRSLRQARAPQSIVTGAPGTTFFRDLWRDLRFALRALRAEPSFAAAAILTIALGIGVNSAIFALVDATLLRPLPYAEPDRLVMAWETSSTEQRGTVSALNMLDWKERSHSFDSMGGYVPYVGGMVMSGTDGVAETVSRQWVTADLFEVLGVKAIAGRTFLPSDDRERVNAVVLSEAFWQTRFNREAAVIGSSIRLDGRQYTVMGVVPKDFQLLGGTSIWALLSIHGTPPGARGFRPFRVIGRMKPGIEIETAGSDMASVAQTLTQEFPNTNEGRGVRLEPLHDVVVGSELRLTSMIFLGVVGLVLLVCCANVANLLLTRATVRTRELAMRSALGASRQRVIRQLLTEGLVLSLAGGVLGLGIGVAILSAAPALIPEGLLPAAVTLTFDIRVVAFCAAAALVAAMLSSLAPAWKATSFSLGRTLASGSRTVAGRGGTMRNLLVAGEVAIAVLLLVGAGLLLRTLLALENIDRGYRAEHVLTMIVDPLSSKYPTRASLLQFFEAVDQEVMSLPGVEGVAWASTLPLGASYAGPMSFEIAGDARVDESKRPAADYQIVSPSYFETLDLPVVAGRSFAASDSQDGVQVCIVNEAFVRRHLQGRSPIGMRVELWNNGSAQATPTVREIVGVARQVKGRPEEREDFIQVYVPIAQDALDDMFFVVRPKSGRAEDLAPSVRAAIGRVDTEQLVSVRSVMTLNDIAWEATARHRFRAVLAITFAGLTLLLAMVGVFGILAYSIEQRVREFGVRRALGATTRDVLRVVVGSALRIAAAGTVIGLALAALFSRLLDSVLVGVQPLDPVTFVAVALVLTLTVAASAALPAWHASRIDPAVALRGD